MDANRPDLWIDAWPWPGRDTHKHSRGRLGIVGSGPARTGATRLAARAGMRIGAGLTTVFAPPEAVPVYAAALEAAMLRPFQTTEDLVELARPMRAVVIGPNAGVGATTAAQVLALARLDAALALDADALTSFEGQVEILFTALRLGDVLTPHEGEFDRLFPGSLAQERASAAAEAAARAGAVVVLKGARTIVAAPDGRLAINPRGGVFLATGGTGDVLIGLIGGLLAQGMPAFEAACAAAWVHLQAAERFGPGLTAEDLPDAIPPVLRRLYGNSRPTG